MTTLRNTCILLSVCLAVSFCTSRVHAQGDEEAHEKNASLFAKLWASQETWYYEIAFLSFMAVYIVNLLIGRAQNEKLAIAWTNEMVKEGSVLDRNFSLLGPGDTREGEVLLKESMHEYKLWASGRRYCQSLLVNFILKKRQDLMGMALEMVSGDGRDIVDVEIAVNEGCMPPIVLAIGVPSIAKGLQRNMQDVEAFTRRLEVEKSRLAGWPAKGLLVLGEHSTIFYDLMTPHLMDLLFGPSSWPTMKPYFRSLHITSEYAQTPHKQVIRLSFYLPPQGDVEVVQRLLTLATVLIDIVGTYKLSQDQDKRAREARARKSSKPDADKEAEEDLKRKAEERKLRKHEEEKDKLRKMTPEQRARYEEKKRKKQIKSAFRVKMV